MLLLLFVLCCSAEASNFKLKEDHCEETTEYLDACGRKCERSCENAFLNEVDCRETRCQRPACKCKRNLVRHNNLCIKKEECPRANYTCPKYETLNYCGNGCELTCQDVIEGLAGRRCPNVCEAMACTCERGYARLGRDCVRIELCNVGGSRYRLPGDDEIIDDLDPYPQRRQDRYRASYYPHDPLPEPGVRIDADEALRRMSSTGGRQRPRPSLDGCPDGEWLDRCGRLCEPTCNNTRPDCPRHCSTPACVCREGLVRNAMGYCVRESFCRGNMTCPRFETLNPCGNHCELKCEHVVRGVHPECRKICLAPACACKEGTARSPVDNTCVKYEACYGIRYPSRDRDY